MSAKNVKLAREGYEAWNRGDLDWFLEHMTEDAEVQPIRGFAGFDDVYHGHEGWKKFWQIWRGEWQSLDIRVQRIEDMGEHGALVLVRFDGVGRASGAEVSMTVSHWLKFREGMLAAVIVLTPEAAERRSSQRD